jgi:cell division protease FtsH
MKRLNLIILLALAVPFLAPAPALAAESSPFADRSRAPSASSLPQMPYSQLLRLAANGDVKSAQLDEVNAQAVVTLTDGNQRLVETGHESSQLADTLSRDGVDVTYQAASAGSGGSGLIPLMIVGVLLLGFVLTMILVSRRQRRARASLVAATAKEVEQSAVKFTDVAGCDEAVEELRDTLDFLLRPERFERVGATMPSGILLYGPPGTGKTLLAKALAGEAGLPFFATSGSDFVELYVGTGPKRVRELFRKARQCEAGAVVFIDEIDAIGRRRGGPGSTGGGQESENTLNALLVELDGFAGLKGVICIAATNRMDMLDPALLRPGRFGMQIQVETPDESGRRAILELYSDSKPLADEVDLDSLAAYTAGSSGAQLADMLNQAAIIAARAGRDVISDSDLREGHLRVLAGPERAAQVLRPEERRLVAWHEAGHVLSAELLETQDKAQRVTIRPRGRAAGLAVYGQTDRALHSRRYFHERMICILAGRAAEKLLVGEISSGAANDLQQANLLARRAVLELGFSERVGQLISHEGQHHLSDETRHVIDEEVERLVADAYLDALSLLSDARAKLDTLAEMLLEHGQMERIDILAALGGTQVQRQSHPRSAPRRERHLQPVPSPEPVRAPAGGRLVAFAGWLERRSAGRRRDRATG